MNNCLFFWKLRERDGLYLIRKTVYEEERIGLVDSLVV